MACGRPLLLAGIIFVGIGTHLDASHFCASSGADKCRGSVDKAERCYDDGDN